MVDFIREPTPPRAAAYLFLIMFAVFANLWFPSVVPAVVIVALYVGALFLTVRAGGNSLNVITVLAGRPIALNKTTRQSLYRGPIEAKWRVATALWAVFAVLHVAMIV